MDLPDWLLDPMRAALGDRLAGVMAAARDRAPVYLRVNRLKSDLPSAVEARKERAKADTGLDLIAGAFPFPRGRPFIRRTRQPACANQLKESNEGTKSMKRLRCGVGYCNFDS